MNDVGDRIWGVARLAEDSQEVVDADEEVFYWLNLFDTVLTLATGIFDILRSSERCIFVFDGISWTRTTRFTS